MVTEKGTILKITAGKVENGANIQLSAKKEICSCNWCVKKLSGTILQNGETTQNNKEISIQTVFDAKMWSVQTPVIYIFEAHISYNDGETEKISDRFGFRYFEADEKYLYLNGFPFYMRAYIRGAAAHEHQNNCNLSEFEFYKKNIMMAKEYGFNTIRFHTTVPSEECFRAADELGMLIHIEMRQDKMDYDNLKEMLYGKDDFLSDEEILVIINRLYNHPSFMVYCVGNEIRNPGTKPRLGEICRFIKKHDSTRLFIDTCSDGEYDRDYVDFDVQHMSYFYPYKEHRDMFYNTDNLLEYGSVEGKTMLAECENGTIKRKIDFPRPVIAHEICHYTSWRDFYALKEKFEKYNRVAPWWVDEEIKMIEAKGYKENFGEILQITKDFQFRCWKTSFEELRASKFLSGFHFLQFADTDKYENSNGVVDCFDDYHGISAEEFRAFNADTVLLARLPKQTFTSGEKVSIPVVLSQYLINPPEYGTFKYELAGENKIYSQGTLDRVSTRESGIYEICSIDTTLPQIKGGEKLVLKCSLDMVDGTKVQNSWEIWVFENYGEIMELNARKDMKDTYLDYKCSFNSESRLLVTDKLDDSLFEKLDNGENILLIYRNNWTRHLLNKKQEAPKYAFRALWDRYKGVIWDRGTQNGGYDEKELLNKYGFSTDGQINYQYYNLIDDSDKINLDDFPIKVKSLISGIDKSSRDRFDVGKFKLSELMYDRTMRRFSYAFEMKLGKGKLLVTGLNFKSVNDADPASRAMLKALVNYCNSDEFMPEAELPISDIKTYLSKVAQSGPNKEGMMTQYWQLDAEPVESMEYWEESERYLRED